MITIKMKSLDEAIKYARENNCHVVMGKNTHTHENDPLTFCGKVIGRIRNMMYFDDGTRLANRAGFKWIIECDFTEQVILKNHTLLAQP